MSGQFHFKTDLAGGFLSFVNLIFTFVAIMGHITLPWPLAVVRISINVILALVVAGKVAKYLKGNRDEDLEPILYAGSFMSAVLILALFGSLHMGVLSTVLLLFFSVIGYGEYRLIAPIQEDEGGQR